MCGKILLCNCALFTYQVIQFFEWCGDVKCGNLFETFFYSIILFFVDQSHELKLKKRKKNKTHAHTQTVYAK